MSVGQKLMMLKIHSTSVTFLSLPNLEAAPEQTMQIRRLIKRSNEREYLKKSASNRVKTLPTLGDE